MGRAIVEFFEALLRALSHDGDLFARALPNLLRLLRKVFEAATLPEVLLLFAVAVFLAAGLAFFQAGIHLAISALKGWRARVFISYQHHLEESANELAAAMRRGSIAPTVLPFVNDPDHDELLDRVKSAIQQSDLVVCLPGSQPSFVENEVSMAFALNKPLLFVLDPAHRSRLPNTAKKGYPLFDLESLRRDRWRPLIRFSSYLAGDVRSTLHLYATVFEHLKACAAVTAFTYGVSIVIGTGFVDAPPATHQAGNAGFWQVVSRALAHPLTTWFLFVGVLLFLTPYLVFFLARYLLRSELRHAVSGRRFDVRLLPDVLQHSLRRADLERVQLTEVVAPEHEAGHQRPGGEIRVGLNRGKIIFHILCLVGGGWLYLSFGRLAFEDGDWFMIGIFVLVSVAAIPLLLLGGASLMSLLVRGGPLLVSSEGIVDSQLRPQLGLVPWEKVIRASKAINSPGLRLKLNDQAKSVEIDLAYYKIAPETLLEIVLEHVTAHRDSVAAEHAKQELARLIQKRASLSSSLDGEGELTNSLTEES